TESPAPTESHTPTESHAREQHGAESAAGDGSPPTSEATTHTPEAESTARITISAERLVQRWNEAQTRALAYLAALGVPEPERGRLARAALILAADRAGTDAVADTLATLRTLLL